MERRVSTRVLLVHRYELARRGLRRMLEEHEDMEVVGEAGNAVEPWVRRSSFHRT